MNTSRITRWRAWLIGAPLLIVCGCAGSQPEPAASETMQPADEEYEREAPRESSEETPPPNTQEPAEHESPPATGTQEVPEGAAADSVTQEEIDEFAEIQIALIPLQEQYSQQAQAGASPEELQQLQDQLQLQMTNTIQESALSKERFNEMSVLVQRDRDLLRRVQTAIQQKTGEF